MFFILIHILEYIQYVTSQHHKRQMTVQFVIVLCQTSSPLDRLEFQKVVSVFTKCIASFLERNKRTEQKTLANMF